MIDDRERFIIDGPKPTEEQVFTMLNAVSVRDCQHQWAWIRSKPDIMIRHMQPAAAEEFLCLGCGESFVVEHRSSAIRSWR